MMYKEVKIVIKMINFEKKKMIPLTNRKNQKSKIKKDKILLHFQKKVRT